MNHRAGMGGDYAAAAHYRVATPSSAGADLPRLPVLMLHGLGGDLWQLWATTGTDPARLRLAPDLRAHGGTKLVGADDQLVFTTLVADLVMLLKRLEFPPAAVVGVSMGAGVAAGLALAHPHRVRALALIRPAWMSSPVPQNLLPFREIGLMLRRWGPTLGAAQFSASDSYLRVADRSAAAAASLLAQFSAPHAVARAGRLIQLPMSVPFRDVTELAAVTVPAVVIGTAGDPQHPLAFADRWAAAMPGSRFEQLTPRDQDPVRYAGELTHYVDRFLAAADADGA